MHPGVIAFLWLVLISAPGSAVAALSINIQASRGTTVSETAPAPLAVMFRTNISDADFLVWHCEWNFGDDDSAEWANSPHAPGSALRKKNRAIGAIGAHVYESPGTYAASVTCANGSDTGTAQVTITVDDPNAVYAGNNTICVSPSGQFGFPECSGAIQDTRSDLTAVLNSHLQTGNRVLLHRGETWSMSGAIPRSSGSNVMLGAYGTGPKPRINGPSATAAFPIEGLTEWTFADFEFQGSGGDRFFVCAQGGCEGCTDGHCGTPMKNILFHNIDVLGGVSTAYLYAHSGLSELEGIPAHKNLFIVGGSIEASGVAYNRNALFGGHNGGAVLGIDMTADTVHNIRIMCQLNAVFQQNNFGGTVSAGDDFRHCSFPNDARSKRVIISDNAWRAGGVSIKPNGTSSTVGAKIQYGVFERNLQFRTLQLKHLEHWVVRDNVCNRGNDSCWQIYRGSNNPQTLQDVHVYNNSQKSVNASGYGVVWYSEIGNCVSECTAKNNLIYSPPATDGTGGVVVQISGVDVSNNINNPASSPFVVDNPLTVSDFQLNGSTSARDGGAQMGRFGVDIGWNCRSSSPDVGAWESAGGTPQCLSEAVPALLAPILLE